MDNFQTILIIIGVIAIIGVSIHGFLNNRKEQKSIEKNKQEAVSSLYDTPDNSASDAVDFPVEENNENVDQIDFASDFDVKENELINFPDEFSVQDSGLVNEEEEFEELDLELENEEDELIVQDTAETFSEEHLENDVTENNSVQNQENENKNIVQETELFIFNVVAKDGGELGGHELLQYFLTSGFRFGEMSIFHRHEHSDGTGPILFSIANMMVPGIFDLDTMEQFKSEGVSFFLTAPNTEMNINESFKMMLTAVEIMAEEFDCTVLNGNREPLTEAQFIEYQDRLAKYN